MKKVFLRFYLSGILIFSLGINFSYANDRIKSLDRMMYTINPALTIEGPQFRDPSTPIEKSVYVSSIVKSILKEADSLARKYLLAGDSQAYYSFLTLALTVPLHEGLYIHFRNTDGDVCSVDANSGAIVKKVSETTYKIFLKYFKTPNTPFIPECSEMTNRVGVRQLIRGGDGTDLSIMQVSIRWHFDDFLANKKYESVQKTLNYGFTHLLNGFDPVYRNSSSYPCLYEGNKINYINLIRGIWAGKYNSGSLSQTCRFADVNSPYRKHDMGFLVNVEKMLKFNGAILIDYVGAIKPDDLTAEAIKEIVSNLKEGRDERKALNKLLGR